MRVSQLFASALGDKTLLFAEVVHETRGYMVFESLSWV